MAEKKGKYDVAVQYYQNEIHDYPDGILPDRALYNMAQLEDKKLNDQTKAAEYYKQIILNYPGSIYIEECPRTIQAPVKRRCTPRKLTPLLFGQVLFTNIAVMTAICEEDNQPQNHPAQCSYNSPWIFRRNHGTTNQNT